MKRVNYSLIGVGAIAESAHIPALLSIPEARIVNICDINQQALDYVGDKFSISNRYKDFKDAITSEEVDGVIVCSDAFSHADIALFAIECKKPVFIEKPITLRLTDAEKIYKLSQINSVQVMVGYQLRHMPNHIKVKEYLDKGMIGKIYQFRVRAETLVIKPDESLLIDYGTHFFDLVRFYFDGKELESIYAQYILDEAGIQVGATTFIKFKDISCQIIVETYWVPRFNWSDVDRSITILGEYGKIITKMSIPEISLLKVDTLRGRKVGAQIFTPKEAKNIFMSMGDFAYRKQIEIFTENIIKQSISNKGALDGLMALKIAQAAFQASKENNVIKEGLNEIYSS